MSRRFSNMHSPLLLLLLCSMPFGLYSAGGCFSSSLFFLFGPFSSTASSQGITSEFLKSDSREIHGLPHRESSALSAIRTIPHCGISRQNASESTKRKGVLCSSPARISMWWTRSMMRIRSYFSLTLFSRISITTHPQRHSSISRSSSHR